MLNKVHRSVPLTEAQVICAKRAYPKGILLPAVRRWEEGRLGMCIEETLCPQRSAMGRDDGSSEQGAACIRSHVRMMLQMEELA